MAKVWSGFFPQNIAAKEEWALLEQSQAHRASENAYSIDDQGVVRNTGDLEDLLDRLQKSGWQE